MISKAINTVITIVFVLSSHILFSQNNKVQQDLVIKVENKISSFPKLSPSETDPVAVKSVMVWSQDKTQFALILKASILNHWHIYSYVPEGEPYIPYEINTNIPEGIASLGDWNSPESKLYERNIFIYEGDIFFTKYFSIPEKTRFSFPSSSRTTPAYLFFAPPRPLLVSGR